MIELYAVFCLTTALTLFITVQFPIFMAEKPVDMAVLSAITFWITTVGVSIVCAPLMFAFLFSPYIYAEKFGNAVRNLGQG